MVVYIIVVIWFVTVMFHLVSNLRADNKSKKEANAIADTTTKAKASLNIKKSYQLADDVEVLIGNVIAQANQEAIHEEYSSSHRFYGLEGSCLCDDCNKPKAIAEESIECVECGIKSKTAIYNNGLCKHCNARFNKPKAIPPACSICNASFDSNFMVADDDYGFVCLPCHYDQRIRHLETRTILLNQEMVVEYSLGGVVNTVSRAANGL